MKLGSFSISLAVKDLKASQQYYEKLGSTVFAGVEQKNYLIMKNEATLIGLFQGMFENNILTFNPGWDQDAGSLDHFDDVREIQKTLDDGSVSFINKAEEGSDGPAGFMIQDPDGNTILIDQHVPKP